MEEIRAYGKINLTLDVLRKRDDGYHDLCSIMHCINLYDTLTIEPYDGILVECEKPLPDDSATYRAARAYMALTGRGARIRINKYIPDEAGMGAASANAAAALAGMDRLYHALSRERLYKLGSMVGADVPFCMMQGCALAEGIGDMLAPLPQIPLNLLIVKANGGISTKALFESLSLPTAHPDTVAAIRAVKAGDARALAACMFNALEEAATQARPEIASVKRRLLELGAWGAAMTGSGSAVVGVFPTLEEARELRKEFTDCCFTCACSTL